MKYPVGSYDDDYEWINDVINNQDDELLRKVLVYNLCYNNDFLKYKNDDSGENLKNDYINYFNSLENFINSLKSDTESTSYTVLSNNLDGSGYNSINDIIDEFNKELKSIFGTTFNAEDNWTYEDYFNKFIKLLEGTDNIKVNVENSENPFTVTFYIDKFFELSDLKQYIIPWLEFTDDDNDSFYDNATPSITDDNEPGNLYFSGEYDYTFGGFINGIENGNMFFEFFDYLNYLFYNN